MEGFDKRFRHGLWLVLIGLLAFCWSIFLSTFSYSGNIADVGYTQQVYIWPYMGGYALILMGFSTVLFVLGAHWMTSPKRQHPPTQ